MTTLTTLDIELTEAQQIALAALLRGATVSDAAGEAGVSRQTASHWRNHDPVFVAAMNRAERDALTHAHTRLRRLSTTALDILEGELAEGGTKASRAARDILRFLERIGPETIGPTDPEKVRRDMEEAAYLDMLQSMVEGTDPDDLADLD